MRILVNARHLIKDRLEGIGIFTAETLKLIVKNNPEVEFIFAFDRKFDNSYKFHENVTLVKIGPKARHPILFNIWFNYSVKKLVKKYQPVIFLSPDGFIPINSKIPCLAVIHDIAFEHYPQDFPKYIARYLKKKTPVFVKNADRIATVSEFTKQDIIKHYKVDKNKIDVVYNGSINDYKPIYDDNLIHRTKHKYTKGSPYFVYVGSLHPRKNIPQLLKAFDTFKSSATSQHKLLVVGRKMWWTKEMEEALHAMAYKNDVIFTGRVPTEDLKNILSCATALTYVSYFEGFGIPIIEAFNAGTAVITSNCSSLKEVAADAAILCDPFDHNDIAKAMAIVSENDVVRNDLIKKGFERAKEFSWEKSAKLLWESLMKTI